jgi:hypothetical protein
VSNHTGIILKKMEEMMAQLPVQKKDQAVQIKRPGKRKAPGTDPWYICGERGHLAPQCPERMNNTNNDSTDKKTKQTDPCYKYGQLGHWISECPHDVEPRAPDRGAA